MHSEALPGVLGNRGTSLFISGEQGNKGQIMRGTNPILGNREHRKRFFRILGNSGSSQFISGEQGNRYPPGRASIVQMGFVDKHNSSKANMASRFLAKVFDSLLAKHLQFPFASEV